jgi:PAS domain S-box-containing protein
MTKNENHHQSANFRASTDAILESISDGVFTVDDRWRITSFNRAAEEITGVDREEAIGRPCCEVFRASMCETDCALGKTLATGEPIINRSAYIIDADGRRIPISVSTALLRDETGEIIGGAETFRDLSLEEALQRELTGRFTMGDMVSRSPRMRQIFDMLPQIAAAESTLLIQGETGTGKELLARAVHERSPRSDGPFVAVNCGALPDSLLESELFGYKAGAFTGAQKDKPGRFALAAGGTLFLDEIGEVSPALQVRLLRVIQEKTYESLGATASETADVRFIAASNRDLARRVKEGAFRQDLFYRINVLRIEPPPLRRRREDIPLLIGHFLSRFKQAGKTAVREVSPEAMAILMAHDFPGNIRELENTLEHAIVLCDGDRIEPAHLPRELAVRTGSETSPHHRYAADAVEAQTIAAALRRHHGNRTAAARELGIHKSTLYRKISAYGIPLPEADGRSRPVAR